MHPWAEGRRGKILGRGTIRGFGVVASAVGSSGFAQIIEVHATIVPDHAPMPMDNCRNFCKGIKLSAFETL